MSPALNRLIDYVPPFRKVLALPTLALSTVVSKDGMSVYASSDTLFRGAVFGRDSLTVADDLLDIKPALVRNILLTLGRLQGISTNNKNEEQPGKIIHEYRTKILDGRQINGTPLQIFDELAEKWGGTSHELAYYGSIDATPHFLRTLGNYCQAYGTSILDESVKQRNKKVVTMHKVAEAATNWLTTQLSESTTGLLAYKKVNPRGISNQVWKDSKEFYVHENREMANHEQPIASIEVQGLAYDALMAAATFFPEKTSTYTAQAYAFRDRTISYLWQPERHYFALGLDYDSDGSTRVIHTPTANPATLLDTNFFTDLAPAKRQKYVTAIIKRITAKDFLTNAGIRSRSLDMAHLVPFWDYHGSYVTWPKETYTIARGLRRHGFQALSRQLENRLMNIVLKTHEYPEFVYVDEWGRILAGAPTSRSHGDFVLVEGSDKPERLQAWTVSAIMAIIARRGQLSRKKKRREPRATWQASLENSILARIPHMDLHINPIKLWLQYPTHKYFLVGQSASERV